MLWHITISVAFALVAPGAFTVVLAQTPGGPVSDDFNTSSLNTGLWTFVNPVGDATLSLDGSQVLISLPAGEAHDPWTADNSARIMQPIANQDFEVVTKMDRPLTAGKQEHGILVEQAANTFLRFDLRHDGTSPRLFAASIVNGTGTFRIDHALPSAGTPFWLKVKRSGNTWTESYSSDGTTFTTAGTFSLTLVAKNIGLFAGNNANPTTGVIPAFTAAFDYFYNTASAPAVPDLTLTKSHTGSFVAGGTGSYTLTVRNAGSVATSGMVTVTDTLPGGLTPLTASGANWTCTNNANAVTCTSTDRVAAANDFPAISLPVAIASNVPASVTNSASVSGGGETNTANNTATDPTAITGGTTPGAPVSDDFNTGSLDTVLWTFVNPVRDATLSLDGSQVLISLPAGKAHDPWTVDNSARIMQPIANQDFEVVTKMDSLLTAGAQMLGILVEQAANTFLRFDLRHDGTSPRIFAASIVNGTGTFRIDHALPSAGTPFWLKVKRTGNTWTEKLLERRNHLHYGRHIQFHADH